LNIYYKYILIIAIISKLVTPAGFEPAIFWMRTSSESRRRLL
jgi:hypothetical protein